MDISGPELTYFLKSCQQAAQAGGEILLKWLGKTNVSEKNSGDLVTEADYESQKTIRDFLENKFPEHSFLGEEEDGSLKTLETGGFCWVVDPLDGTTNFVHQLRSFAVSVALTYRGEVIVGTVLDPVLNECYSAAQGQGADLNGETIQTSDCDDIQNSLLVCSFSTHVTPDDPQVKRFLQVMHRCGSIRRLGSAALNLCYVGCGRLDGYWATSVSIWDIAAGMLILEEAGGIITHIDNTPLDLHDPQFLASANPTLHQKMLPLMNVDDS